jgi:hypothetical protein
VQVIKDMIPFLIVLNGAGLGLSISTIALDGEPSIFKILEAFQQSYRIGFGDFFTD